MNKDITNLAVSIIIAVFLTSSNLYTVMTILDIPIGAIFDSRDVESQQAFELGILQHRQVPDNYAHFRFNVTMDTVDTTDTYQMASAICRQMSSGVFAIMGQKSFRTTDIVRSLTNTFNMPFVSPSLSRSTSNVPQSSYQLQLRPDVTNAIISIVRHFNWKIVHYIYDSDDGLLRLQLIFQELGNQSAHMFFVIRISDIIDIRHKLRKLDIDSRHHSFRGIILDLSSKHSYDSILRQIPEVGMNKYGYDYILGSMDFKSLNLSRFMHGGANVIGFQLLNEQKASVERLKNTLLRGYSVTAALTLDALKVIESGIMGMLEENPDVFRWTFRRRVVYNFNRTRGVLCNTNPPIPWMHGLNILNKIKQKPFHGLSGKLSFSEDGTRNDYVFLVYAMVLDKGPKKIGTWSTNNGYQEIRGKYATVQPSENKKIHGENTTTIITSILSQPFLSYKVEKGGVPLVGNERFEGYSMDLAKQVSIEVGFDYVFKLVADGNYGLRDSNGTWNGMIGELIDGKAEMAIAGLTITAERERYVDFSKPFMQIGLAIIIKKPQDQRPGVFSFMEPLSIDVWVCITMAYIGVSVVLFLVSRFSPVEWSKDPNASAGYKNEFSIFNSLWFSMGALMLQGSDNCPKSLSGRIIGGAWWFFVLIIVSSYTANLAAFLTMKRMVKPIESVNDLANHPTIKYGVPGSGTTFQFFKDADLPVYTQMYEYMNSHPENLVSTSDDGIQRVRDSKGKYAFMTDSSAIDFANNREPCDTTSAGQKLNNKGFGIATPRGSNIRDQITLAVLRLKEGGTLHTLQHRWWVEKGQCGGDGTGSSKGKTPLTLSNVAGIFYILISGLVLAVILGIFEFQCFRKTKVKNVSDCDINISHTYTQSSLAVNTPCQLERLTMQRTNEASTVNTSSNEEYTYKSLLRSK